MEEYQIIRSSRKTMALEVGLRGVVVRAPFKATEGQIRAFVMEHQAWIQKHLQECQRKQAEMQALPPLTEADLRELAQRAMQVIPERVRYFAPKVGVDYGRITIRNQRTKWGSCSAKGNLNFNCLLMLAPPQVLDSIVVHELCHRKQMNHSEKFYAEVLRVCPDYWKWDEWLKIHGRELMYRMTR